MQVVPSQQGVFTSEELQRQRHITCPTLEGGAKGAKSRQGFAVVRAGLVAGASFYLVAGVGRTGLT